MLRDSAIAEVRACRARCGAVVLPLRRNRTGVLYIGTPECPPGTCEAVHGPRCEEVPARAPVLSMPTSPDAPRSALTPTQEAALVYAIRCFGMGSAEAYRFVRYLVEVEQGQVWQEDESEPGEAPPLERDALGVQGAGQ